MFDRQLTFLFAIACGALAYLLPLALWLKRRSTINADIFAIPALVLGSWWLGETLELVHVGAGIGLTFYGALPAAIISNVFILVVLRSPSQGKRRNALVVGGSIVAGLALHVLLPAIPE